MSAGGPRQNRVVMGGMPQGEQYEASGDNQAAANEMALKGIEYGKKTITMYRPQDAELWEIVSDVPRLTGVWPYVVCILCIVLPGSGTMISSCVGYTTSWSKTQLFVGILQMLTAVYIIGWLWSIWWGIKLLKKGLEDKQEVQQFLNKTNAKSEGQQQQPR